MITPEQLERKVQQEVAARTKILTKTKLLQSLSTSTILTSIPQLTGLDRLNQAVVTKVENLKTAATTQIQNLAEQLNISDIDTLNPTIPDICPSEEILDRALNIRNNLISEVENVVRYINIVDTSLNAVANTVNGTIDSLTALNILKTATGLASKTLPAVPGLVTSTLSDLDDIRTIITFKSNGNPRLPELKRAVDLGTAIIAQVSSILEAIIKVLKSIDAVLEKCNKQPATISTDVDKLINIARTAQNNNVNLVYQGFTFEIVEKPYSTTLKQSIGQAKNRQGIVLLQTEPSFTNNPQQLIDELKFIIDRDNLKAD